MVNRPVLARGSAQRRRVYKMNQADEVEAGDMHNDMICKEIVHAITEQ